MNSLKNALQGMNNQTCRLIPVFRDLSADECRNWDSTRYEGLDVAQRVSVDTHEVWTELVREVASLPGFPAPQVKQPL